MLGSRAGSAAGVQGQCGHLCTCTALARSSLFQEQVKVCSSNSWKQKLLCLSPSCPFPGTLHFLLQVWLDKNRAHLKALNRDPKCCFEWTLSRELNSRGKFLCSFSFLWVTAHFIADQICQDYGKRENGKMTISPKQ